MEPETVFQLVEWVNVYLSRERFLNLELLDYPHLKGDARRKIHKGLYKQSYPDIIKKEQKALTLEDLARMGNGG